MRGSKFICDSIDLLYYRLQNMGLKRGRSHIDSPEWLKNKKATINPKNMTVALNHKQIKSHPEII